MVQSTRAGAAYGFSMLGFVVAANLLKYPFFEYGSRYASVTGRHLIEGYARLGRPVLYGYFAITLCTMFFVTAAVTAVTAGFFENILATGLSAVHPALPALVLLGICTAVLIPGSFRVLDVLIKVIATALLVSTVVAFAVALARGPVAAGTTMWSNDALRPSAWPFIIALMGWMPTAVDLSTWNSLWTLERIRSSHFKPTLRETLREFDIGYAVSAGLSVCFLTLGALLLYGTDRTLPDGSAGFATGVLQLYTETIGAWSFPLMAVAGFSVMLGTSFGVLDGYARSAAAAIDRVRAGANHVRTYRVWLLITALGAGVVLALLSESLRTLVDLATTLSFLVAPFIAILNHHLVTRRDFPARGRPALLMRALGVSGILFLTAFAVGFVLFRLGVWSGGT